MMSFEEKPAKPTFGFSRFTMEPQKPSTVTKPEDDEDPFDAYMKNIETQAVKQVNTL
jgi:ATP-dependent RNA helicase DDX46/PRP5